MLGGFAAGALACLLRAHTNIRNYHHGIFQQLRLLALYVCVTFAIGDDSNTPPGSGMSALIYGFMTYVLSITMGSNGLGISPARDLGPRCVAWWVGYGRATFSTGWWAYGPIAAGLTGSFFGALIYEVFIFVGGESPVNYRWPTPGDIKWRAKSRKDEAKQKLQKLPV
ncbi:hypothetical protein K458DRAFT_426556 [Lentithecium fluviatile CBS 122367]|uniref:Aquaporin-like protein n=1 Tax=Lentithecium fluviatile CBS 122367 TaxID=1168545 RepID=A0A6G1JM17_9PLEO|nr:hypothetical protein K458DRAFT_426556 [Lentithecium fluviatile CBS 122367]